MMGSEVETLEERSKSSLVQLHAECAILERMVYKNKNQHRRCSYFQYLLKVRRGLRLLQSAKLADLLSSCFQVITGKKSKQKVHLLERKPNFIEQLRGAARLLSQILLDVVSVFNIVSYISQKKQSVKLTQEGIAVFREFYPTHQDYVMLECVWQIDKFVLLKSTYKNEDSNLAGDGEIALLRAPAIQYRSIDYFLEEECVLIHHKTEMGKVIEQALLRVEEDGSGSTHNASMPNGHG